MPPFSILESASEDSAAVADLAASAFQQYKHRYTDWQGFETKLRRLPEMRSQAEVLVAKKDGQVVGAVAYVGPNRPKVEFFKPEWPIMRMLVVAPAARGLGVGRALVEECLSRARRDEAEVFALHTSEIMEVALVMYLRMGFEWHAPPRTSMESATRCT